jgi:hypothetical protein
MVSIGTKALLDELRKDMTLVSLQLSVFRTLYADDPVSVDLLNTIAPGTFRVIQESLQDSIVLRISRMTDQPKTRSQDNLTLETLIEGAAKDGETKLVKRLRKKYPEVIRRVSSVRKLRHKVTGHTDRAVRLGVVPVPSVRLVEVSEAVESIGEFLNVFEDAVNGTTSPYALSIMDGEAGVLLRRLREAVAYRQEVPDWHLLDNPQRQRIGDLLQNAQPKDEVKT